MNLELWIPGMVLLGLVTMSLLGLFIVACDNL